MSTKHISDAARDLAEKADTLAHQFRNTLPEERIRRGVELYGWKPDADCDECGDTGIRPISRELCVCPVGWAKRNAEREEQRIADWERRWELCNVPRRFRGYRLGTSPLPAGTVDLVRGWLAGNPVASGANLIVTGSVGSGKTGLAIGALWEVHMAGNQPLHFASCSGLIDALRPNSGEDGTLLACQKAAALVLDDLGTTRGSPWETERLFALFDARYADQRPTIVTTNVTIPDLAEAIGERLVSRLMESAVVVPVDAVDFRRTR